MDKTAKIYAILSYKNLKAKHAAATEPQPMNDYWQGKSVAYNDAIVLLQSDDAFVDTEYEKLYGEVERD